MEKLIITVALTGSVPRKKDRPYVLVTSDEIAETAYSCEQAGASIIQDIRSSTSIATDI